MSGPAYVVQAGFGWYADDVVRLADDVVFRGSNLCALVVELNRLAAQVAELNAKISESRQRRKSIGA